MQRSRNFSSAHAPYLGEIPNIYRYGDIWERPQLSARHRSLAEVLQEEGIPLPD